MIHSMQFWRAFQHNRLTGKAVLLFVDVLDEPEALVRYVHWSHWTLKAWTKDLDRLGIFVRAWYVRIMFGRSLQIRTKE